VPQARRDWLPQWQAGEQFIPGCDEDARGFQLRTKEIEDFIVRALVQVAIAEVIDRMADSFERAALLACNDAAQPVVSGDMRRTQLDRLSAGEQFQVGLEMSVNPCVCSHGGTSPVHIDALGAKNGRRKRMDCVSNLKMELSSSPGIWWLRKFDREVGAQIHKTTFANIVLGRNSVFAFQLHRPGGFPACRIERSIARKSFLTCSPARLTLLQFNFKVEL